MQILGCFRGLNIWGLNDLLAIPYLLLLISDTCASDFLWYMLRVVPLQREHTL